VPHIFERAPTSRAKCRVCGGAIATGEWRFGERLPNPYSEDQDVEMTHWFHVACAAFKRPEPFVAALEGASGQTPTLDGLALFEHEARLGLAHRRLARVDAASRAPSSRATCRACKEKIEKGTWRIALVWYEDSRFVPAGYIHLGCAPSYLETTAVMVRLRHCSTGLTPEDFAELESALQPRDG
jgi:hypothetical protein